MNQYRVLMEDSVNDKPFNFAMVYEADSNDASQIMAVTEFPGAKVVEVRLVEAELSVNDLLNVAFDPLQDEYIAI